MIKVVDIECLKNKYFHRVGTQFDNAISVAEKEFLIDAYTKTDIVVMLTELQMEIIDRCHYQSKDNPKLVIDANVINTIIQQKIDKLKEKK